MRITYFRLEQVRVESKNWTTQTAFSEDNAIKLH